MSNVYVIKDGELYHAYSSGKNQNIGGRRIGNMSDVEIMDRLKKHLANFWNCKTTDVHIVMSRSINAVAGPAFEVHYLIKQTGTKNHSGIVLKKDL